MLRSSHDACGCSTQTTSTINLKRSTLHPHEGQADRPNTPSDPVNRGSNPGPPATKPLDTAAFCQFSFASKFVRHVRRLRGTIFENTNKPLRDWYRVIHSMLTSKKGISARQVWRYMGFGSLKTAWYM